MFTKFSTKVFKSSSLVNLVALISLGILLNEICSSEASPFPYAHNLSKLKAKMSVKKRAHIEPIFDEVNRCILACAKCSEDLFADDDKDPEQSRSITCANECLSPKPENKDPNEALVLALLSNNLFDKAFVKCFVSQSLNPTYDYLYE